VHEADSFFGRIISPNRHDSQEKSSLMAAGDQSRCKPVDRVAHGARDVYPVED
jgi:hypothetical protein